MDQDIRNLTSQLGNLVKALKGNRGFDLYNSADLVQPDNADRSPDRAGERFAKQLEKSEKILTAYATAQSGYMQGIARGIPIVSTFSKLLEKNSRELQISISTQSD